jgi:hypothetical protein
MMALTANAGRNGLVPVPLGNFSKQAFARRIVVMRPVHDVVPLAGHSKSKASDGVSAPETTPARAANCD